MPKSVRIAASLATLLLPLGARAQDLGGRLLEESATGSRGGGYQAKGIPEIVGAVISTLIALLGVIFLILLVYGGYLWMIARGNDELVTKAKDTIRSAIIGLIILLSAYAITAFVVSGLTRATGLQG
jgi:hypothetical protein